MWRTATRVIWWVFVTERPRSVTDALAIAALAGLAVAGALALSWPWVSTEVPRAIATGWTVVQTQVGAWLRAVAVALPIPG
jgi:hypothetical protein